jgi:hypothetical protein
MQRTLQTADRALGWLRPHGVPFIALAQWQETSVNRIDIGRPMAQVAAQFPWCDFSHMDPVWPAKKGLYEFSQAALVARGVAAKRWLLARPEKVIVVVSHAGFLRTGICNRNFGNADFRVFGFGDKDVKKGDGVDEDAKLQLVESDLTARNGGGMGNSQDGFFGWQASDFKWMPENNPKVKEELERTGHGAELHGTEVHGQEV